MRPKIPCTPRRKPLAEIRALDEPRPGRVRRGAGGACGPWPGGWPWRQVICKLFVTQEMLSRPGMYRAWTHALQVHSDNSLPPRTMWRVPAAPRPARGRRARAGGRDGGGRSGRGRSLRCEEKHKQSGVRTRTLRRLGTACRFAAATERGVGATFRGRRLRFGVADRIGPHGHRRHVVNGARSEKARKRRPRARARTVGDWQSSGDRLEIVDHV